ncbi:mitochondrial import protein Pam17-domain-containing protein [Boeremia exigua]|uniref:mitochondrial import protein Pam17-domain-containing protein n=1 Tax=Boeremia exigua TaxID=749465 RepID=UPI001E8CC48C|nr:mitochondrial import protein Pam17-domain-containing protein [Boeremia exigua]KAH6612420.1 mitochondrial import protein Pam17-domain-containing protein [Boeremia exigua]
MLARSALCPARAFANRHPPAILAPCSTSAPFSTCTRPSKPQSQTPFFTQRALARPAVRNASTSPAAPSASSAPASAALTWNDFFALRRTRRRIGQACSGASAIGVTYYGLTFMINNGYDAVLSEQLGGFDPMMLMGLSTLGMLAAGWLIGPIPGNQVFNLAYRGVLTEFTRKDSAFFNRIKRHRVDPSVSSLANPPPDYYGEKIGSVAGYRRWLKDQRAFNLKTGRHQRGQI